MTSRHRSADEPHEGAARLTGAEVEAINRFPDDNPNPVMRYDGDGHLIYANPASAGVLSALGARVGSSLAPDIGRVKGWRTRANVPALSQSVPDRPVGSQWRPLQAFRE